MRMRPLSACVVLACTIVLMPAVGMRGTAAPAQASIRIARTTHVTVTRTANTAAPTRPAGAGLPGWLKLTLLAAGLLIAAALLNEPLLARARRRHRRERAGAAADQPTVACSGPAPAPSRAKSGGTRIVDADYHRLVVTHSAAENTVYVLRPPGTAPQAILRVARVVLAEEHYTELAARLGLPASWPIVLADHHRVVVTCSKRDGTVYVLRPPGEDPRAVLRAARLVLPEDPYEELADLLGVPGNWPI
jgi:hypothetical protein